MPCQSLGNQLEGPGFNAIHGLRWQDLQVELPGQDLQQFLLGAKPLIDKELTEPDMWLYHLHSCGVILPAPDSPSLPPAPDTVRHKFDWTAADSLLRASPPSQPWRDCVGAGPSGPF